MKSKVKFEPFKSKKFVRRFRFQHESAYVFSFGEGVTMNSPLNHNGWRRERIDGLLTQMEKNFRMQAQFNINTETQVRDGGYGSNPELMRDEDTHDGGTTTDGASIQLHVRSHGWTKAQPDRIIHRWRHWQIDSIHWWGTFDQGNTFTNGGTHRWGTHR